MDILNGAIHVIGDSHTVAFSKVPECIIHNIGPVTMHRIGRDGLDFLDIKMMEVQDLDSVVFVFGEIDVRCHIGKQRDEYSRNINEIIATLSENYMRAILDFKKCYPNLNVIIYGIIPPSIGIDNIYYPIYGTLVDRVLITQRLNRKLKRLCEKEKVGYLDIYDSYSQKDGSINLEYCRDSIHIHCDFYIPIQTKLYDLLKK